MNQSTISWIKRLIGLTAFLGWGYLLFAVMSTPVPFSEQAPYCMAGTMLIFGVLTAVFKGLERWEAHIKAKES